MSLYGATKKCNELMAHSYAHLFQLPVTGLRFFTVYGPWGRPDMAIFTFTRKIIADEPIDVFNNGQHTRDFTYIDDIVEGVVRTLDQPAQPNPAWDGSQPRSRHVVGALSHLQYRQQHARRADGPHRLHREGPRPHGTQELPAAQPGDMAATYADVDALIADVGFRPATPIQTGIDNFVAWYRNFYGKN